LLRVANFAPQATVKVLARGGDAAGPQRNTVIQINAAAIKSTAIAVPFIGKGILWLSKIGFYDDVGGLL
jgi:hypothetical protein